MKRIVKRVTEEWIDPGSEDQEVRDSVENDDDADDSEDQDDEADHPPTRSRRRR